MDSGQAQLRQQIHTPAFTYQPNTNNNNNTNNTSHHHIRRDGLPRPTPIVTMNGSEIPVTDEMSMSSGTWTPLAQAKRPRPATIHEGFSYGTAEQQYNTLPAWDPTGMALQTPSDIVSSRPGSMHGSMPQDYFPMTTMEHSELPPSRYGIPALTNGPDPWGGMKACEDSMDCHSYDSEMIGQAYTADDAIPILDLRYPNQHHEHEAPLGFDTGLNQRRMSGSSFTMSTSGGMSDMPSYEEFSAALSEAPSFTSDYPPTSNRNSLMSSTQLSPVASPRMTPQSRSELVRTQSRGRGASPSPRPGVRSAPYTVDSSARNKRWSTGSYGTTPNRRQSPFVYHHSHDPFGRMSSRHSSPTISNPPLPLNYGNLQAAQQHGAFMMQQQQAYRNSMLLPSQLPSQVAPQHFHPDGQVFEAPPPLLSHGLFRMLQSNADPHSLHGHYTDLSDPPDLYAALHEEQIPPPPEDMNPEDPDMVPHEQELRFEGDLYTPRWVRGHGNKREGWCGICKPGRWLVLKNSAFWYDKSFTHGISAATGSPFQEPRETRRMDGNPDVWEGLCGSCNDWIALVSSKKKGTTWFRHAYKCHTHPKVKDAPKRRRESSHSRALAASQMAKPKVEPHRPITPQSGHVAASVMETPAMSITSMPRSTPMQPVTPMDDMSNMI